MSDKSYCILAVLVALTMGIVACIIAPPAAGQEAPIATMEEWRTDSPPELEPILAMWGDTMYERAHVCTMYRGEAYEYGPPDEPMRILETTPPTYWRRLP